MAIFKQDFTRVKDADQEDLYKPRTDLKMSVTQFESSPKVQEDAEKYFGWVSEQFPATVGGVGGYEDIGESLRDEDMRLTDMLARGVLDKEMPNDVKEAYQRLRDTWDNKTEIKGFKEGLSATVDYATDIVSDPLNLLGFIFTGGSGVAAKETVKTGVKATLKKLATDETKGAAATRGAVAGGAWSGLDSYAQQSVETNAGMRDGISLGEVGLYTAVGSGLGAGLGVVATALGGGLTRNTGRIKNIEQEVAESSAKKEDLEAPVKLPDEEEPPTMVTPPWNQPYGKIEQQAEKAVEEATTKIEVGATPFYSQPGSAYQNLSQSIGGGQATSDEIQDIVEEAVAQGTEPRQIKNKVLFEVGRIANAMASKVAFKPASLLDSFTPFSSSALELQKKFRYDLGRNIWGDREYDAQDFYEVFKETAGEYYVKTKVAMEPIQINVKGNLSEPVNAELVRVIRGATSENENLNKIGSFIREEILGKLGRELNEAGFIKEPTENYFPRWWNRTAILNNQDGFASKLVDAGEAKDLGEAQAIIREILDKKNQLGEGSSSGANFFAKRVFTKIDDNDFADFLDSDANRVLINYSMQASKQLAKNRVFGVKNFDEFEERWINPIVVEMEQAGKTLSRGDRKRIADLYRTATGEGVRRFENETFAGLVDVYSTANRLAYLPLAALSSVTEIFINVQKAGVVKTIKGFSQAANAGRKTIQTDLIDLMKKDHDLKEPEIWRELNRFSIALDTAAGDVAERLAGDTFNTDLTRKINNGFFRFTMLDQWTKLVQLTSFITGKELITDNLKKIAARGDLADSRRIKRMRDELNELGVNIDEGVAWVSRGAKEDDDFYRAVQRGASRYTNEVILQPTPEAGIKPSLMSNPRTSILFQFMGYPAAFSNTILKNAATKIMRDPVGNVPKTLAAGLIMTETARWTNWARSHGESEKLKSEEEIYVEAVKRWGGNGMVADMMGRAQKSAEIYQSQTAYLASLMGPFGQDVYKMIKRDSPIRFLGEKVPFYGALRTISPELKENYDDFIKDLDKQTREALVPERPPKRFEFKKGGEVLDVPKVSKEPDERIDKMTGLPYDQQAGTAFIDEEDPLRRLGFKGGGAVSDPLRRLGFGKGSITRVGRKVYHDEEGQSYSEKTETIQLDDGRWVNYPTIDKEGNKIPERLFKKLVESQATKEGVVDFITGEVLPTFKDKEEAIEQAVKRSKSLLEE